MDFTLFENVYGHRLRHEDGFEAFCQAHTAVNVLPGTLLLKAGRIAGEFYLVEKGMFRSYLYDYQGNEVTTEFYGPNDILIESFSLFHRQASKENFQAVTAGTVWKISYADFERYLQQLEGLREWGRSWSTEQLFRLKKRSIESLTVSATERYLLLLKDRPQVVRHCPLKYIASYLGITDSSLSRIRKEIAGA